MTGHSSLEISMRGMTSIFTSTAALIAVAGTLSAQQPKKATPPPPRDDEPRGTICYSTDKERSDCTMLRRSSMDSAMMKRAALGLQLTSTGTSRDTIGVFVSRVVPKGPAETAGIVEGDRIVSINGTDLRVSPADAGDSYAGELPSRRLSRAVEKLSPGNVVTLRVSSGGRVHDVQVTAGRAWDLRDSGFGFMLGGGMDGMLRSLPKMNMEDFNGMRMENFPRMKMEYFPRMNMEMMPKMNPEQMKRMEEGMMKMRENMPMIRERLQEMPMRLREMEMAPMYNRLRDGATYKTFGPTRVRIMGPEGTVYVSPDGRKTWTYDSKSKEKIAAEKKAVEKAKKEKEKDKN
jgi:hypothetical protein